MNPTRRDILKLTASTCLAATCAPVSGLLVTSGSKSVRCINVINFIRAVEPREPMDLFTPVQRQMEIILANHLPATWLLQFDALVSGPFVEYLKSHMAKNHEVGLWFEMNEMHCKAAGVEWRGRPGFEWDSQPSVAFTIGYTPEERKKLVDAAMNAFKGTFGHFPSSVASWNLDSISAADMSERYHVDAFAVCRDQIATDGFTIWGAPIAGYYPSKANLWSPALEHQNQINTPVFRMLGQDPVYYYQRRYPTHDGRMISEPDTMEPVWYAGRSPEFVKQFLNMIAHEPTLGFAYAQLGQENSFGWPSMEPGYEPQMKALAALRDAKSVHVETMGDSGRRFKKAFKQTPAQAQVMLHDPFGNTKPAERTIWYQSRFYRANLHIVGDSAFLRDITVYSDHFPQPFLDQATRQHDVEQRMPAVLDGYHWAGRGQNAEAASSQGHFQLEGARFLLRGEPSVSEQGSSLITDLPLAVGGSLIVRFNEREISIHLESPRQMELNLEFRWDPSKAALVGVGRSKASFHWLGLDYQATILSGDAHATDNGWTVTAGKEGIRLNLAQA